MGEFFVVSDLEVIRRGASLYSRCTEIRTLFIRVKSGVAIASPYSVVINGILSSLMSYII